MARSFTIFDASQEHVVILDKIMSIHRQEKTIRIIFLGPRSVDFNMDSPSEANRVFEELKKLLA